MDHRPPPRVQRLERATRVRLAQADHTIERAHALLEEAWARLAPGRGVTEPRSHLRAVRH